MPLDLFWPERFWPDLFWPERDWPDRDWPDRDGAGRVELVELLPDDRGFEPVA